MTADLSSHRFRAHRQSGAERPTGGAFSHSLSPKPTVMRRVARRLPDAGIEFEQPTEGYAV